MEKRKFHDHWEHSLLIYSWYVYIFIQPRPNRPILEQHLCTKHFIIFLAHHLFPSTQRPLPTHLLATTSRTSAASLISDVTHRPATLLFFFAARHSAPSQPLSPLMHIMSGSSTPDVSTPQSSNVNGFHLLQRTDVPVQRPGQPSKAAISLVEYVNGCSESDRDKLLQILLDSKKGGKKRNRSATEEGSASSSSSNPDTPTNGRKKAKTTAAKTATKTYMEHVAENLA